MSTDQWKKENTQRYRVRVSISSGLPAAVKAYAEDHNITETGAFCYGGQGKAGIRRILAGKNKAEPNLFRSTWANREVTRVSATY